MLTFSDFARGAGGKIARRLGVPCDIATGWDEYTEAFALYIRDDERLEKVTVAARCLSTGEMPVACALLHAVGLSGVADEVGGVANWRRLDRTFGDHRLAVVAAILRQDNTD